MFMKKTLLFSIVVLFSLSAIACDGDKDKSKSKGGKDDRAPMAFTIEH